MRSMIAILMVTLGLAHGASGEETTAPKYGRGWSVEVGGGTVIPALTDVDEAFAGGGAITYRVSDHFALGLAADYVHAEQVDVEYDNQFGSINTWTTDSKVDQYSVGLLARLYGSTGRFQPYVGVEAGALHRVTSGNVKLHQQLSGGGTFTGGSSFSEEATSAMVKPTVGLDLYLTESLFVGAQAGYFIPLPVGTNTLDLDEGGLTAGARIGFTFGGE